MAGHIILFTDAFPFGEAEAFLPVEVQKLCDRFESVTVVPLRHSGNRARRPLPANADVVGPLLKRDSRAYLLARGLLARAPLVPMVREFFSKKVYRGKTSLRKWAEATSVARVVLSDSTLQALLRESPPGTILYFYWSVGTAWALPFIKADLPALSRFHGFDLYEERPDFSGYIPFREPFLKRLQWAIFISEHGRRYLCGKHPWITSRTRTFMLGVDDAGVSHPSPDDTLRLVSCSRIVSLKRLDLIVEALHLLDFPVEWTHFGDGPERPSIERLSSRLPSHISCSLAGNVPNEQVRRWYREQACDLFVNVSNTEGAPVSIMEALSAGIPVIATAVGGTPELVDERVGMLLPVEVGPKELARALRTCRNETGLRRDWAKNARERWDNLVNAERNYSAFIRFLEEDVL